MTKGQNSSEKTFIAKNKFITMIFNIILMIHGKNDCYRINELAKTTVISVMHKLMKE